MMIYYVALPFVRLENGGLVPGEAVECPHSSAVLRRADAMYRNGRTLELWRSRVSIVPMSATLKTR
jgi:hypothetical protein